MQRPRGCLLPGVAASASNADAQSIHSFTVRDSIELRRMMPVNGSDVHETADNEVVLFSPDHRHFIVPTRRGSIQRDEIVDELLLFSTGDVNGYLESDGATARPVPRVIAERTFHQDWMGISSVKWMNEHQVGYIAGSDNGSKQVFSVDVDSDRTEQLTNHVTDVVSFSMSDEAIVFFARRSLPPPKTVVPVGVPEYIACSPRRVILRTGRSRLFIGVRKPIRCELSRHRLGLKCTVKYGYRPLAISR